MDAEWLEEHVPAAAEAVRGRGERVGYETIAEELNVELSTLKRSVKASGLDWSWLRR